jgi:hypothetical protein
MVAGAKGVVDVGAGGRTTCCGDASMTGTSVRTGVVGPAICDGAAGSGLTVAWAFGRAGRLRASEPTIRLKMRITLSTALSATTTRPTSGAYVGASRATRLRANHCTANVRPRRTAPAAPATEPGRRSSLVRSAMLPKIAPIVAPTIISLSCRNALKIAGSKDAPYRLPTQPARPFRRTLSLSRMH